MSLELTENKSNISSGALNKLVFILYCRVIGQWLPTCRLSVGNQSAISWGVIGNRLAIGRRLVGDYILSVCFWLQKVWKFLRDRSATDRRLGGDQSATKKLCRVCLQPLQLVGDQSPTSRRPVGNLPATTKNRSTIDLVAERFHLQQPKPPCDQIVPATGRRPVADLLATASQPPCDHPKFWSQGGRRPVASYVWPGL